MEPWRADWDHGHRDWDRDRDHDRDRGWDHDYDRGGYAPAYGPPPVYVQPAPAAGTGDTSDAGYSLLDSLPSTAEQEAGLVPPAASAAGSTYDPNSRATDDTVIPDTGATDSNGNAVAPPDTSADSSDMAGEFLYGDEGGPVLGKSYEDEVDLPTEDGLDVASAMLGYEAGGVAHGGAGVTSFGGAPHAHYHDMGEGPPPFDSFAAIHDTPAAPATSFGMSDSVEDLDWGAALGVAADSPGALPLPDFAGEMYPDLYRVTTIKL